MLAVLGAILEGVATAMSGLALNSAPTFTISMLVLFVAIARWNLWGLMIAPILVVGTIIGGKNNFYQPMAYMYDWRIYLSSLAGLLTLGVNVAVFKKNGTKKTILNTWLMLGMVIVNYVTYNIVQYLVYYLCVAGVNGEILYHIEGKESVNVCRFAMQGFVFNLFGLAAVIVGLFILRSQGVVNNVVDKLVEDKKRAELDHYIDAHGFDFGENANKNDEQFCQKDEVLDSTDTSSKD